jgi:hypothetical protein
MAQFNPKEFVYHYRSGKPAYYSYDEELYCGTFPEEWAENHLPGTGPKDCNNCAYFGSWNGVFLGYCANCADYEYNGECGRGFVDCGKENDAEEVQDYSSAFDTYLKDVTPDDVGDKDFMDSAQMLRDEESEYDQEEDISEAEDISKAEEKGMDDIIAQANAYYDELSEKEREDPVEVGWFIDRCGGGYGSNFDGGYDSY